MEDELDGCVPRSEGEVVRGLQEELGTVKAKYIELGNEIVQVQTIIKPYGDQSYRV